MMGMGIAPDPSGILLTPKENPMASPVSEYLGATQLRADLEHTQKCLGAAFLIICVLTAALTGVTVAWLT
jgi:hypothetical protein